MKIEKIGAKSAYKGVSKLDAAKKKEAPLIKPEEETKELSNVCYRPISFGKKYTEHTSWGARVNPDTKAVSFKVFVYPDTKAVSTLIIDPENPDKKPKEIAMENKGNGVFEVKDVSPLIAKEGSKYQFQITKQDGSIDVVKDPYTFKQEEVSGASTIYDQSAYPWDKECKENWAHNPDRITRLSDGKDGHSSVRDLRIFALSPDSFTKDSSYEGVIPKLKEIKQNGFNAVEIMHVENTYSFNWGYDGVDKSAPSDYLGGPDALKKLVDEAHKEGLNVIFDIIPNHLGPDGAQLKRTGPYIKGPNDFGEAFNFEGENSEYVKDYIVNQAFNWVDNYHVDGLRLDMTKYMQSDYTLKQLAAELNYHHPDCFLIAEDGRGGVSVDNKGNFWENKDEVHDKRVTSKLWDEDYGRYENEDGHTKKIRQLIEGKGDLSRLGMDSEWDFNFYHHLDGILYNLNTENLTKAVLCAQDSVKYVASHDEIGNFEGTRKIAKLMVPKLRLNDIVQLSPEDIQRAKDYQEHKGKTFDESVEIMGFQKAQFAAEKLATMYQKGELDKYYYPPEASSQEKNELRQRLQAEVLSPMGIASKSKVTYNKIANAFLDSYAQNKMAQAFVYTVPGPKMVFQGDERADLTPFRFFRKFESVPYEYYLYTEKGYEPAEKALQESTLGKIKYSKAGKKKMDEFKALTKDLNTLNIENPALRHGYVDKDTIVEHPLSQVIALEAIDEKSNNQIFTISNFGTTSYREDTDNEYYIKFPKGRWVEVLNTDDTKYGGTGLHSDKGEVIHGDGHTNCSVNLACHSVKSFKRIG